MNLSDLTNLADQAATAYGVPTNLFRAVIAKESNWNEHAIGSSGEYGLAQLMPQTALGMGINQYDTQANLTGGAALLSGLFAKFGNWTDALRAYNAGPSTAASDPTASAGYAKSIMDAIGNLNPIDPNSAINNVPDKYNPFAWAGKSFWAWLGLPDLTPQNLLLYGFGVVAVAAFLFIGIKSLSNPAR